MEEQQTELENKNTTNNAGITQLQACDIRHRQIQEVNSLCTDSKPLRAEYCIVGTPHNTAI